MDPHEVLGLPPDAGPQEAADAYRRLAKRWHPDRRPDAASAGRMAEINAAYQQLRRGQGAGPGVAAPQPPARVVHGGWLPEERRRRLGPELLRVLEPREDVALVLWASTWASPQTVLAVTDRRLLWLHDDAVTGRVRSLRYGVLERVEVRRPWPRRRGAALRVLLRGGRRITFAGLSVEAADDVAQRIRARMPRRSSGS